ncbi:MAG: hypothetical protein CMJ25_25375 [Phycisphaerae bacterium]|nr:hypothetical protein [Phycisphaerae bacterium]
MVACCSKYNARQLRTEVSFQRETDTVDSMGGAIRNWAAISGAPTRAMVKPLTGREMWGSDRLEAIGNYKVVTRYFSGLTEKDRIVIDSRNGQIRFVANVDYMDDWLEITVQLGPAT